MGDEKWEMENSFLLIQALSYVKIRLTHYTNARIFFLT
jgi:hypothetical protein